MIKKHGFFDDELNAIFSTYVSKRNGLVLFFSAIVIWIGSFFWVQPAYAGGCYPRPLPGLQVWWYCGTVKNYSSENITVAKNMHCDETRHWPDNDHKDSNGKQCIYTEDRVTVFPGENMPNDTIRSIWEDPPEDIDAFLVHAGCLLDWQNDWDGSIHRVNMLNSTVGEWYKINKNATINIINVECSDKLPEPPTACSPPSSWPSTKSYVNIWTTAMGKSGIYNGCPQVGQSYTYSNPQYVWCRKWGDEVRDSNGNYNHWWLWTDLDSGGRGWISAYYIKGQGNDQADDINTGQPIPSCN